MFDVEQGHILEDEAKPFYTAFTGEEIQNCAFIEMDDGRAGCSPDGLIGDDCGLEIKCPRIETHIGYLLQGELPRNTPRRFMVQSLCQDAAGGSL